MEFIINNLAYIIVAATSAALGSLPGLATVAVLLYNAKSNKKKTDADAHKILSEAEKIDIDNMFAWMGKVEYLLKRIEDLVKEKQMSESLTEELRIILQQVEIIFREFLSIAHVGYWEAHTDGGRFYFNETWLEIAGMKLSEAKGDGWRKCIHPEDLDRVIMRDEGIMQRGATLRPIKCRIVNQKTQEIIEVEKTLYVVWKSDGTAYKYIGKMVKV